MSEEEGLPNPDVHETTVFRRGILGSVSSQILGGWRDGAPRLSLILLHWGDVGTQCKKLDIASSNSQLMKNYMTHHDTWFETNSAGWPQKQNSPDLGVQLLDTDTVWLNGLSSSSLWRNPVSMIFHAWFKDVQRKAWECPWRLSEGFPFFRYLGDCLPPLCALSFFLNIYHCECKTNLLPTFLA